MKTLTTGLSDKKQKTAILGKKMAVDLICTLIILLFVYAATSKILDFNNFRHQLGQSPFITKFASLLAWGVPAVELAISGLLLIQRTRLIGLYFSLSLMSTFTAYIFFMLNFSYYVPCSCGGILSQMGWVEHLWFNIGYTLLAAVGIVLHVGNTASKES